MTAYVIDAHAAIETHDAEYIALTQLHGVALVAGSDALREKAAGLVRTETADHLPHMT